MTILPKETSSPAIFHAVYVLQQESEHELMYSVKFIVLCVSASVNKEREAEILPSRADLGLGLDVYHSTNINLV